MIIAATIVVSFINKLSFFAVRNLLINFVVQKYQPTHTKIRTLSTFFSHANSHIERHYLRTTRSLYERRPLYLRL